MYYSYFAVFLHFYSISGPIRVFYIGMSIEFNAKFAIRMQCRTSFMENDRMWLIFIPSCLHSTYPNEVWFLFVIDSAVKSIEMSRKAIFHANKPSLYETLPPMRPSRTKHQTHSHSKPFIHAIYCYDFISNDLNTGSGTFTCTISFDSIQFKERKKKRAYSLWPNECVRPNGIHLNIEVCLCDGKEEKRQINSPKNARTNLKESWNVI